MAHKIIENNREIYVIFEDVIEIEDFNDYNVLESVYSNKDVTIDISNVSSVKTTDCLAGLYIIGKEYPNVKFKGFSEDYKKSIDYRMNL